MLQRRKIIISGKGIQFIDFLGRANELDWPKIDRVDYSVNRRGFVFYSVDKPRKKMIPLYYPGLGDLTESIRQYMKPETYESALFIMDFIRHCQHPSQFPSTLTAEELGREIKKRFLGGGTFKQRYIRILGPGLIIAGIIVGMVGLYDLTIKGLRMRQI
jgi:hypothetical protein